MFLSKLELYGFKSFSEKTTIEFKRGITAVVGPNGCGKSNVLDAIRWALGEQSSRALRGTKMEEVIFGGTSYRKPLNFAEVSLTFKGASSLLKVDYDEITITRRIYRSGEGEYFINKSPCRLKDISGLLVDTGLGREGYSILSQGQVEWLLSARPDERREIFEEAAEIHKYKLKKRDTTRRLEEMGNNMLRIKDLLAELENMLPVIKAEAELAEKYRSLAKKLKESRLELFQWEYHLSKRRWQKYQEQQQELAAKKEIVVNAIQTIKETVQEKESAEGEIRKTAAKEEKLIQATEEEIESLENEVKLNNQEIKHLQEKINVNESSTRDITSRKKGIMEMLTRHEEELKSLAADQDKKAARVNSLKASLQEKSRQFNEQEAEEIRKKMSDIVQETARKDQAVEDLQERSQRLEERQNQHSAALAKKKKLLLEQKDKEKQIKHTLTVLEKQKREVLSDEQILQQKKNQLDKEYKDIWYQMSVDKEELSKEESSLHALREMAKEYSGYAAGVKYLLKQKDHNDLIGTVASLLRTSARYEAALEAALGGALQFVVAANEHAVKRAIEKLKQAQKGRVTFLPLSVLSPRKNIDFSSLKDLPGVVAPAVEVVETEDVYRKIVDYLLGAVLVTEDLDAALNAARRYNMKGRFVTLEGELINPGGQITGGSLRSKQEGFLLGRERKIKEIERRCLSKRNSLQKKDEQLNKCTQQLDKISNELEEKKQQLQDFYKNEASSQSKMELMKAARDQLVEEINNIEQEQNQLKETLQEINRKIELNKTEKEKMQKEEARLSKMWEEKVEAKRLNDEEMSRLQKELVDLRVQFASLQEKESTLQDQVIRQKDEYKRLVDIESRLEKEKAFLTEEFSAKGKIVEENRKKILADKEELKKKKDYHGHLLNSLQLLQKEKNDQLEKLQRKQDELTELENRSHALTIDITKLESELKHQEEKGKEDFGSNFTLELPEKGSKPNKKTLQEKIVYLEKEIESLGEVNLASIEELRRQQERIDFLYSQLSDLQEGEHGLKQVLARTDRLMKKSFTETMEVIQQNFQQTYKQLFGGGKAYLHFSDPDNILETGVEVIAQPPGKKLQNINLLSSGEKALSAIALLFAIMMHKPSPLYVLDEIDTALDESNLVRYISYLRKQMLGNQVILMTHRRQTMEEAELLYGVTMEEPGVSKVYSLKMAEMVS